MVAILKMVAILNFLSGGHRFFTRVLLGVHLCQIWCLRHYLNKWCRESLKEICTQWLGLNQWPNKHCWQIKTETSVDTLAKIPTVLFCRLNSKRACSVQSVTDVEMSFGFSTLSTCSLACVLQEEWRAFTSIWTPFMLLHRPSARFCADLPHISAIPPKKIGCDFLWNVLRRNCWKIKADCVTLKGKLVVGHSNSNVGLGVGRRQEWLDSNWPKILLHSFWSVCKDRCQDLLHR